MSASPLRMNAIIALAYVALAGLVMLFFELPAPLWPSTGLAVFAALAGGRRWMPGVAVGSWIANDLLLEWSTPGALWVTLGNIAGPMLGLWLFRKAMRGGDEPFASARGVGLFFLLLGALNGLVSALFGATGTAFIEGRGADVLGPTVLQWAMGDAASAVLLAPAIYLWWRNPRLERPGQGWTEFVAASAALLGLTAIAFFMPAQAGGSSQGSAALLLLPLTWVALRLSQRDAYTLLALTFLIMLAGTLAGHGPFAGPDIEQPCTSLQLRIVVLGALVLLASALDLERQNAIRALAELNATLERRVLERTRQIEASHKRLRMIVEALPTPMAMTEARSGIILEANDNAAAAFGYRRDEVLGRDILKGYLHPEERPALLKRLHDEGVVHDYEIHGQHRDGHTLRLLLSAALIQDGAREVVLFAFRDITQSKLREHELERMATIDGLTGAANRTHFLGESGRLLLDAAHHGWPMAMLILDLDHFKQVNDTHGHLAGDEVLRRVTQAVQAALRHNDMFGRLGGEEFGVLLSDATEQGARELAERLRVAVEALTVPVNDHAIIRPTISIGGALLPEHAEKMPDVVDLLTRADHALYEAKDTGRNRVVFWHPGLQIRHR